MKKKETSRQREINSAFSKAGPYLNIGYFFIGAIALFGYLGYKLDQAYETNSIFMLVGLFIALGLSFYNMFKVISQIENKK